MRWNKLKKKFRDVILYGSGKTAVTMRYDDGKQSYDIAKPFEGVIPNMERRWQETDSSWIREELSKYQTVTSCDACGGNRLKPEALAVRLDGKHIGDVAKMSIDACGEWFTQLHTTLNKNQNEIARRILREINDDLVFCKMLGWSI